MQDLVAKKTLELFKRHLANPKAWHFELEKMKDDSFAPHDVFKIAVTAGDRMIFIVNNDELILCEIGKHEVMKEYSSLSRSTRDLDISKALPAPDWFTNFLLSSVLEEKGMVNLDANSESILDQVPGQERWKFEEEIEDSWVAFLDDEQFEISNQLNSQLVRLSEDMQTYFILGGPGTGKTIILLNIAMSLKLAMRSVSFDLSPQVLKYLNSGPNIVPGANLGPGPGVTLLIDDPVSPEILSMKLRHAKTAKCNAVIVALDPLQWHEFGSSEKFDRILNDYAAQIFTLWNCYRQSGAVGEKAIQIVQTIFTDRSVNSLSPRKVAGIQAAQKYLDLSLGMKFKDDMGRFTVYRANDLLQGFEF